MQFIPRYLVNNRVTIIANEAGFITEFRPVYQRHIQVYKGIDNVLQFRILNADQKPINISTYTPKLVAFDENDVLVIERTGTVLDDGSTTANRGMFSATIYENDLLNVKDQFLHYSIHLEDASGNKVLTYANSHFGNAGVLQISSEAFRGPYLSKETTFNPGSIDSVWYTSSVEAQPGINGNQALHTVAFYTSTFSGDIVIQGTLDDQISGANNWSDIKTVTFTGTETAPVSSSFNGVYTYIRFKTLTDPNNKVSNILVRN